jgi:hypothetical protein
VGLDGRFVGARNASRAQWVAPLGRRTDRTFAWLARHDHIAAHHAGELARDSEAEPRPAVTARGQGIGLGEILKEFRLLLRRDTDAGVRNCEPCRER